jgi:hypothetical protein
MDTCPLQMRRRDWLPEGLSGQPEERVRINIGGLVSRVVHITLFYLKLLLGYRCLNARCPCWEEILALCWQNYAWQTHRHLFHCCQKDFTILTETGNEYIWLSLLLPVTLFVLQVAFQIYSYIFAGWYFT